MSPHPFLRLVSCALLALTVFLPRDAGAQSYSSPHCGQLGEGVCSPNNAGFDANGQRLCDRGLTSSSPWNPVCLNQYRHQRSVEEASGSWTAWGLRMQQRMAYDRPLNEVMFLMAHHATDSVADGNPFSHQVFSMTDQMAMGLRAFWLPLQWVSSNQTLRVCATSQFSATCDRQARAYSRAIEEIAQFIKAPENSESIVILYLDDSASQAPDSAVTSPIASLLGDVVFKPASKGSNWPTLGELLVTNKRVIIFDSASTRGGEWLFDGRPRGPYFFQDAEGMKAKNFVYDLGSGRRCGYRDSTGAVVAFGSTNKLALFYEDQLYDGPTQVGTLTRQTMHQMAECNVNLIGVDNAQPFSLGGVMETAMWSWARYQPDDTGEQEHCASVGTDGHWYSEDCTIRHRVACKDESNQSNWRISANAVPFSEAATQCPSGFSFGSPVNGYQNTVLDGVANEPVWINYTDSQNVGQWETFAANQASLRTSANTYVAAANALGGAVTANQTSISSTAQFSLTTQGDGCLHHGDHFRLLTSFGYYVRATASSVAADVRAWYEEPGTNFQLVNHTSTNRCVAAGDVLSLKTSGGKYLTASGGVVGLGTDPNATTARFTLTFVPGIPLPSASFQTTTLSNVPVLKLDGSTSATFTQVPNISQQEMTVEVWLRWDTTSSADPGAATLFNYDEEETSNYHRFWTTNLRQLKVWFSGSSATSNVSLMDGQWHHTAVTLKPQDSTRYLATVYVDGAQRFSGPISHDSGALLRNGGPIVLGARFFGSTEDSFVGQMSDFRVYNVARTQQQIAGDMNFRLTGSEPGLSVYWPLDKWTPSSRQSLVGGSFVQSTLSFQQQVARVSWNSVPRATSYDVQLLAGGTVLETRSQVTSTTVDFSGTFSTSTSYTAQVRSRIGGTIGAWSDPVPVTRGSSR